MGYLIPIIIFVLSLSIDTIVEVAAELSSDTVVDNETGIGMQSVVIAPDGLVDMRPEAALPPSPATAPSLRDAVGI